MLKGKKVGFSHAVGGVTCTAYYASLKKAVCARADFTSDPGPDDLILPATDTSMETNWPRYASGDPAANQGIFHIRSLKGYLQTLRFSPHPVLLVNMQPFIRVPLLMAAWRNVIVADVNLLANERRLNPRTISAPAMPITVGSFNPKDKRILASFRGVNSHPVREALMPLNKVPGIVCEMVQPGNHFGKIDANKNLIDQHYYNLLNESTFAIVPRGDAHFSYRLLEVMSFGCIPVILSDDLVLPFDRTIPWDTLSLHIPERDAGMIPTILARLSPDQIAQMQQNAVHCYARHLGSFDAIADTMIAEARQIIEAGDVSCPPGGGIARSAALAMALPSVWLMQKTITLIKRLLGRTV